MPYLCEAYACKYCHQCFPNKARAECHEFSCEKKPGESSKTWSLTHEEAEIIRKQREEPPKRIFR